MDFSIIIPTYNGATRLPDVFECLKQCWHYSQNSGLTGSDLTGPPQLCWETIVVDNNSSDRTREVVQHYQANWLPNCPLRYAFEPKQGAGYARQHGVAMAQAALIGFLDDDNLPNPAWILESYLFAQAHPAAGAYGSQIHGEFEVEPPAEIKRLLPFLAIVERGNEPLLYYPWKKLLPPSAGLVIRKASWIQNVPQETWLSRLAFHRHDGNHCSEDLEALTRIQQAGWEIWYNPHMEIRHKIPQHRLTHQYLAPLFQNIGQSRYVTRMLSVKPRYRPGMLMLYCINDLRKIVLHLLKYRQKIKTDLAARCELILFWHSLTSPFHIWSRQLLK